MKTLEDFLSELDLPEHAHDGCQCRENAARIIREMMQLLEFYSKSHASATFQFSDNISQILNEEKECE